MVRRCTLRVMEVIKVTLGLFLGVAFVYRPLEGSSKSLEGAELCRVLLEGGAAAWICHSQARVS